MSILYDWFELFLKLCFEFYGLTNIFLLFHDDYLNGDFEKVNTGDFGVGFDPMKNIVLDVPKIEKINKKQYTII